MKEKYKTYYKTLGIGDDATERDIKIAIAKKRQDSSSDVQLQAKIELAADVLIDSSKKSTYDALLKLWDPIEGDNYLIA